MSVPNDDLLGAAREEALDRGIDFAGEVLAHLLIFGLGLVLAADSADALGIRDEEDGFGLCPGCGADQEKQRKEEAHTYLVPHQGSARAVVTTPARPWPG